jgi:hypothetical protein
MTPAPSAPSPASGPSISGVPVLKKETHLKNTSSIKKKKGITRTGRTQLKINIDTFIENKVFLFKMMH